MAKRTKAQRSKAAKESWERRKAKAALDAAGVPKVDVIAMNERLRKEQLGVHSVVAGYDGLATELHAAFEQSALGKGKERHANGRPFDRQPIAELTRMHGVGFATGQAAKKAQEALGMLKRGEADKARHELHGAIVYLAAAAMVVSEG